ncbi:MAG: T9SS type A sorting domain-containing protein [Flavobacteriales bacterium]|nr:MAG: T9SS type A sorting domain-containing protein [Flavobacteriales bacterium]
MKQLSTLVLFALVATSNAQSWTYVGSACALPSGSAEMEFRSDGSAVAVSFEPFGLSVREWDGSAWSALPVPTDVTGLIGGFDLEIHADEVYLAVSNTALKVYRLDAGLWTALGSGISGTWSTNYDFLIMDNGTPVVVHGTDGRVLTFDGAAWNLSYTLPQGVFPDLNLYGITGDHTVGCTVTNQLVYVVSVQNRQFMRALDGGTETMVGDTITPHAPFTPYQSNIFRNGGGALFVTMQAFGGTPFIKTLNGASWTQFGDSTNSQLGGGNMLLAFRSATHPVLGNSGSIGKRVYAVDGATSTFNALDTLSHAGFAQLTDLDVDPTDGSVHATFNCLPTAAVMKYSGSSGIADHALGNSLQVFPNPANDRLTVALGSAFTSGSGTIELVDGTGRSVFTERVPVLSPAYTIHLASGFSDGMYLVVVRVNGDVPRTARILVQR